MLDKYKLLNMSSSENKDIIIIIIINQRLIGRRLLHCHS